jgi:opine dehydrogenase
VKGLVLQGDFAVAKATTDIAEALEDQQLVMFCVPSSAHEAVARAAAPHLQDGAIIFIQPGATLSALAITHALREAGFTGDVTPVETLNTIFTARLAEPGVVELYAIKKKNIFAALPASRTGDVAQIFQPLFESLEPCSSVLEVSMINPNGTLHPVVTLLNVGQIDRGEDFLYYMDGATPYVSQLIEACDAERVAVAKALGVPTFAIIDWYRSVYGGHYPNMYQTLQNVRPYATIKGPKTMNTRLLLEDIPTGSVPYCSLGEAVGVETRAIRALIDICCVLYETDFWATGRTLERFGLGGADKATILKLLGP